MSKKALLVVVAALTALCLVALVLTQALTKTPEVKVALHKVLGHARLLPAIVDGNQGVKLQDLAEDGFYAQMGLLEGDIILSVNGETETAEFLELFIEPGTVELSVFRDGAQRTVTAKLVEADMEEEYVGDLMEGFQELESAARRYRDSEG